MTSTTSQTTSWATASDTPTARTASAARFGPIEFETCTGKPLPEGDWQTVAGYVIDAIDGIPDLGDSVRTELGEFTVMEMDGYAIARLRVRFHALP